MVTIDELKQDFAVVDVPPYGKCIVIPARMFGAAWENDLKQQGCKIFSGSSDGQAAFFIRLPNNETTEEKARVVYEPQKGRGTHLGRFWTEEEDTRLIQLAKQPELTIAEIAEQMPGRSEHSVKMRIGRLEKKGLLPKRPRRKYKRRKKDESPPAAPSDIDNKVNEKDKLVKELLEASAQLYPKYRHACALLLREAAKEMEKAA